MVAGDLAALQLEVLLAPEAAPESVAAVVEVAVEVDSALDDVAAEVGKNEEQAGRESAGDAVEEKQNVEDQGVGVVAVAVAAEEDNWAVETNAADLPCKVACEEQHGEEAVVDMGIEVPVVAC